MSECYGFNGSELTTVFPVSWDGVTDIAYWRFYARANSKSVRTEIGLVSKNDLETLFIARGYMDWVSVEALSSEMSAIGTSPEPRTPPPAYWALGEALPEPDDPEAFSADIDSASPTNDISHALLFIAAILSGVLICALL